MDVANFLSSLKVMGVGMLGIFIVTAVLILVMVILMKIFPASKDHTDENADAEDDAG